MNYLEKTLAIVAAVLHVPLETVAPGAALADLGPLDSLSLAEIASALDDEFEVRLPSEDLATTLSVRDLAALVARSPRR